ncbi:MAG: class I SAM-dependent methyltransferase, partial [Gemmatimonadetes bacterium]|nr:class I SAM-dependent methyltransferase [Gemmatimonadota bacterium]
MKAGTAGSGDYYARRVASPEYRRSRVPKADVILYLLRGRWSPTSRVADVGTGTGIMKAALEEKSGAPIVGFEIDLPFVEDRDRVVGADATRLPIPDETFDLVILNHIYEHVEDPLALFRETRRVLRRTGTAYVSAGSRWAVLEPHYRLPFLSWLPRGLADGYLRLSGRGDSYEGVRFLGYGALIECFERAGFRVIDVTEDALTGLLGPERGGQWRLVWTGLRAIPTGLRRYLLRGSPQWFFLLEPNGDENG